MVHQAEFAQWRVLRLLRTVCFIRDSISVAISPFFGKHEVKFLSDRHMGLFMACLIKRAECNAAVLLSSPLAAVAAATRGS